MSKIGRKPIVLPSGVTVEVVANEVIVKGPKGQLAEKMMPHVTVAIQDGEVVVGRTNEQKQTKASHGLIRSLIANMIHGVTAGYQKKLELIGTGYRAAVSGNALNLTVGYSHPVKMVAPANIQFAVENQTLITVSGVSKYLVGQVAADIRKVRPPEPYKGKGIRYVGEYVRRKQGKVGAK